jgi:hypothetical protein
MYTFSLWENITGTSVCDNDINNIFPLISDSFNQFSKILGFSITISPVISNIKFNIECHTISNNKKYKLFDPEYNNLINCVLRLSLLDLSNEFNWVLLIMHFYTLYMFSHIIHIFIHFLLKYYFYTKITYHI